MAEIDMEKVAEELLAIKAYFAGQAIEAKEEIIKEVFVEAQQTIENAISILKEHEAMEQCLKTKCVICPHCDNCDVDENGMLKEQEPRLMTLEEVKKHNNKDNCIWFELRDIVIIPVFVRQDRQETVIENPCILSDQTIPHLYWKNIDYCKKWRCWNFKPADGQRKAVKWNG